MPLLWFVLDVLVWGRFVARCRESGQEGAQRGENPAGLGLGVATASPCLGSAPEVGMLWVSPQNWALGQLPAALPCPSQQGWRCWALPHLPKTLTSSEPRPGPLVPSSGCSWGRQSPLAAAESFQASQIFRPWMLFLGPRERKQHQLHLAELPVALPFLGEALPSVVACTKTSSPEPWDARGPLCHQCRCGAALGCR